MRTQTFTISATFFAALLLAATPALANCGDNVDGQRIACRCGDVVVSDTKIMGRDPIATDACLSDGLLLRARPGAKSIRLDLNGVTLQGTGIGAGVRVVDGGSDGAVITGNGSGGTGATITGFRVGVSARGRRLLASLDKIVASHNTTNGIAVAGENVKLDSIGAVENGRDGIALGGRRSRATNVRTVENGRNGVALSGAGNRATGVSIRDAIEPSTSAQRANQLRLQSGTGSSE